MVALAQEDRDAILDGLDVVAVARREHDVCHAVTVAIRRARPEQTLLHEADRREELIVSRAHAPAALGGQHADHPERLVLDAHRLADRRAVAEQVFGQGGAQNGDRRPGAALAFVEQGSTGRPQILQGEVGRRRAGDRGVLVGRRRHDVGAAVELRRDAVQRQSEAADRLYVVHGQVLRCGRLARSAGVHRAGHHENQVGADALHLSGDRRLGPVAERQQRDHGRHTDDHAQHGQERARLVGKQAVERHAHDFRQVEAGARIRVQRSEHLA